MKPYMIIDEAEIQGSDSCLFYVRRVPESDVDAVREAWDHYQTLMKENRRFLRQTLEERAQASMDNPIFALSSRLIILDDAMVEGLEGPLIKAGHYKHSPAVLAQARHEFEKGAYVGVFLVEGDDPFWPQQGFVYSEIPSTWTRVDGSPGYKVEDTLLCDRMVEKRWTLA